MNRKKLAVLVTTAVVVGVTVYFFQKSKSRQKEKCRQVRVSNEGYETAEDVLFPLRTKGKKYI